MFYWFVFALALGLVQAEGLLQNDECRFALYVGPKLLKAIYLGNFDRFTPAALGELATSERAKQYIAAYPDQLFHYFLRGHCVPKPGWNMIKALLKYNVAELSTVPGPRVRNSIDNGKSLGYAGDYMVYFSFAFMAPYTEDLEIDFEVTSFGYLELLDNPPPCEERFRVSPKTPSGPLLVQPDQLGTFLPDNFPHGFTCIAELWGNDEEPETNGVGTVYMLRAESPLTSLTEWQLVDRPTNVNDPWARPEGAPRVGTRFYAKDGEHVSYDFGDGCNATHCFLYSFVSV